MSDKPQSVSTKVSGVVPKRTENVGNPAVSMTLSVNTNRDITAAATQGERTSSRHLPLFRKPLSNHPAEEKVAVMRAAIEAGADVNQLDEEPIVGYNKGRPLDACINGMHMPSGIQLEDNIPVFELLLQHGADPRLGARPTSFAPVRRARYFPENTAPEEVKSTWKRILALFEEAILRLDAEQKNKAELALQVQGWRRQRRRRSCRSIRADQHLMYQRSEHKRGGKEGRGGLFRTTSTQSEQNY